LILLTMPGPAASVDIPKSIMFGPGWAGLELNLLRQGGLDIFMAALMKEVEASIASASLI
jgi:hypothetical protein